MHTPRQKQLNSILALIWLVAITLAIGCKKKDENVDCSSFDRQTYLEQLLTHNILPAYQVFQIQADSLNSSCIEFAAAPSVELLNTCRTKLHLTTMAWQNIAMFDFGPAEELSLQAKTNVYPTDTALIQSKISTADYEMEAVSNLAARGLPAVDYLLHGPLSYTNEDVLNEFTTTTDAANRREYLTILSQTLADQASEVWEMWSASNPDYQENFTTSTGTDLGSSLGMFLNAFNKSYETHTRTQKVGIPVGALTFSQTPLPDRVEGYFGQSNSQDYLMENMLAFENLFLGKGLDGEDYLGLDAYLKSLDAQYNGDQLSTEIADRIVSVKSGVATISSPWSEYVVTNQADAFDLYANMQQLNVIWKVDMMSALGILITYQDNDGD